MKHIDGLVQDCSISIANPLEIPVLHYTIAMKVYGKGLNSRKQICNNANFIITGGLRGCH